MRRGSVFSWTFEGRRKFMFVMPLRMFSLLRTVRMFFSAEGAFVLTVPFSQKL